MRSPLRRRASSADRDSGQALVEFAVVIPIFLLALFGIIQLGLVFQAQIGLVNAVRETARDAAPYRVTDTTSPGTIDTTCTAVLAQLTGSMRAGILGFDSTNEVPTVTYKWNNDDNGDGKLYLTVKVAATYKFPLYVPMMSGLLNNAGTSANPKLGLTAQEEMRVENDALTQTGPASHSC
jgi:Flp pilus assembly protein TadG